MGNTTSGLPWPDPSSQVREGATAIRNLAEAIEPRIWAAGTATKYRAFGGMISTGSDGRVWVAIPNMTTPTGALAAIIGAEKWFARPFQIGSGQVLFEVHTAAGATINSTAVNFAIFVWGS